MATPATFTRLTPKGPATARVSSGSVSKPRDVARLARYKPQGPVTRRVKTRTPARQGPIT